MSQKRNGRSRNRTAIEYAAHITIIITLSNLYIQIDEYVQKHTGFYVHKTWYCTREILFLFEVNWHEIKDHGIANVEMVSQM